MASVQPRETLSSTWQDESYVVYYGENTGTHCGYCHAKPARSVTHGMSAQSMTVYVYQELLDRGWRRSGTYVYKPDPARSCCPAYTIRLDTGAFQPSSSHRRVLRHFEQFLSGEWCAKQQRKAGAAARPGVEASAAPHGTAAAPQQRSELSVCSPCKVVATVARVLEDAARRIDAVSLCGARCAATAARLGGGTPHEGDEALVGRSDGHAAGCQRAGDVLATATAEAGAPLVAAPPEGGRRGLPDDAVLTTAWAFKLAAALSRAAAALLDHTSVTSPTPDPPGTASSEAGVTGNARAPPSRKDSRKCGQGAVHAPALAAALAEGFNMTASRDAALCALQLRASAAPSGHLNFLAPPPARAALQCACEHCARASHSPAAGVAAVDGLRTATRSADGGNSGAPAKASLPVGREAVDGVSASRGEGARGGPSMSQGGDAGDDSPMTASDEGWESASDSDDAATVRDAAPSARADPPWWLQAPPGGRWQLRTVLQPSSFDLTEFRLWQKYQARVHGDKPSRLTRSSYKRFLVDNPFWGVVTPEADPDAPEGGYGAFHLQYWVGEHLIAVSVVDVLPRCVSSKYFIWDPDLSFLSLGKLSALKEIEWVQRAHASGASTLKYSYLGFYIHSCQKMRYKAEYRPSELLCPTTLEWVRITPGLASALDATPNLSKLPRGVVQPRLPPALPPASAQRAAATDLADGDEERFPLVRFPVRGRNVDLRCGELREWFSQSNAELVRAAVAEWAGLVGPEVARFCVVGLAL